ncbi:MAG: hypothetical protein EOM55_00045 [Clostridia bacterium]|nr:hypothetical protein [Clostridia bacterium]
MTMKFFSDDDIKRAVKFGIDKKFKFADISFEGADGEITEEMEKIATQKKAERVFSYEMEKIETADELPIVPVSVKGKVYSKGLFESSELGFKGGYCESLFLLIYVHEGGVELIKKSYSSLIDDSCIVHQMDNVDKYFEDESQLLL